MTYGKSYTYCVKKQRNFYIKKIDIDGVNNINTENNAYYFFFSKTLTIELKQQNL